MRLTRVTRVTVAETVLNQLRQQIISGGLAPGERVPSERELCAAFGVSRTTVREALQGLLASGLIERQANRFIVADPAKLGEQQLDLAALAARLSVREIYEARKLLEVKAAQLAAEYWKEGELEALSAILAEMEAAGPAEFHATDEAFHTTIFRIGHNRVLIQIYEASKPYFFKLPTFWRIFGRGSGQTPHARTIQTGKQGHRQIYRAIAARDAEAAGKAMFDHLDAIERNLIERINNARRGGVTTSEAGLVLPPAEPEEAPVLDRPRPAETLGADPR